MKLLSIAVPAYNSEDYLERCIDSLLLDDDALEILIINDGSKDRTKEIAESYAAKYPQIVRAINQENKGHGGAVNTGIAAATGLYFKVVDSDDRLDHESYLKVMNLLHEWHDKQVADPTFASPDLLIANYVYDNQEKKHKKVVRFNNVLPENQVFSWQEVSRFRRGQYLLMHTQIYKTDILRQSKLQLPEHTFYVDNLFCYLPLPYVKTMYYLNTNLYMYFIGREDQSVQEQVMIKRIDQQLRVNKLMVKEMDFTQITSEAMRNYLYNYLEIITMVTNCLIYLDNSPELYKKQAMLWHYIEEHNPWAYERLKKGVLGQIVSKPRAIARTVALSIYRITHKIFGFN